MMLEIDKIHHMDCLEGLRQMEAGTVDLVATDPPYFLINESGSGFMGKEWESLNRGRANNILCRSRSLAENVVKLLLLLRVESSGGGASIAPEDVSTKRREEISSGSRPMSVLSAEQVFLDPCPSLNLSSSSVHGIVLTKGEVLALLKELLQDHITAVESLNENVLFVIPSTFIQKLLKNTVRIDVLKLPTEEICGGQEIPLTLMDEARINGVIVGWIGSLSEERFIDGTDINAGYAVDSATERRYRRIISSPTNLQKITNWLTWLLFATDVMLRRKETLNYSLMYLFHRNWATEVIRVLKPGAFMFVLCPPRQDCLRRTIAGIEDAGFKVGFTSMEWCFASGFPKAMNISKAVDKRLGYERAEIPATGGLGGGSGDTVGCFTGHCVDSTPLSPEARGLDGSYAGFQPKPAVEVVLVAMKPLSEKTFVDQALKNGKGVTWLDEGRIPFESEEDKVGAKVGFICENNIQYTCYGATKFPDNYKPNEKYEKENSGRFPANLLVSDGVLDDGRITSSKESHNTKGAGFVANSDIFHNDKRYEVKEDCLRSINDSGSFSRYFSLDAWWAERVKKLPPEVRKTFPFLLVPKASKGERNEGCEELEEQEPVGKGFNGGEFNDLRMDKPQNRNLIKNFHPTVKPLQLMSYLVTLGSRVGDLVLDPFAGSGTTAVACRILNRRFIGFEISEEYCKIAEARVSEAMAQRKLTEFVPL